MALNDLDLIVENSRTFILQKSARKGTDQKGRMELAESLQACNRSMHTVDQRERE
jgi:hypothetical protein